MTVGERDLLPGTSVPPGLERTHRPDLEIPLDGAVLRGYAIRSPGNRAAVLYFGGNAEVVGPWSHVAGLAERHRFDLYAVNHRGYGPSGGRPGLDALEEDGLAVFDVIAARPELDGRPLVLFGNSIGAAVALRVASERSVAGVVLEGAPSGAGEVIPAMRGALAWPLRPFLRLEPAPEIARRKPQPIDLAPSLTAPLLSIHGSRDRIVPIRFGRKVFDAAGSADKRFCEVPGAGHNDLWHAGGEAPHACLTAFLRGIEAARPAGARREAMGGFRIEDR